MDKLQQAIRDAAAKVPKGMPKGGGGGSVNGLVKGAAVILGLGLSGYALSNGLVTGFISTVYYTCIIYL